MIQCKARLNCQGGNYPHRLMEIFEEDFKIIRNFLNSSNQYDSTTEVGYSPALCGESINDSEWMLLVENAELLGIEFIVEGQFDGGGDVDKGC